MFTPILRPQVWGGRRLACWHKHLPAEGTIGESWELSPLAMAESRVAEGELAGRSLSELWSAGLAEQLGRRAPPRFPWLVKWLDVEDWLSVQVHPNAEQSLRWLGAACPKAESWVVVHAEPTARIYAGFHRGVTPNDVSLALERGNLPEYLHVIQPQVGDCFYLPPGVVHAAGGGLLLAEIQQPSDATFRLYDWNRVGPDGRRRALHLREALDCLAWPAEPVHPRTPERLTPSDAAVVGEHLLSTPHFVLDRFRARESWIVPTEGLTVWMILRGATRLTWSQGQRVLQQGETVLIPAGIGPVEWCPQEADQPTVWLRIRWPAA